MIHFIFFLSIVALNSRKMVDDFCLNYEGLDRPLLC